MVLPKICVADEIENLIPHIIAIESGGNPNAVSKAGAVGLCQITPIVLKEYNNIVEPFPEANIGDLYYPDRNVFIATWYLRRLRDYYLKDVSLGLNFNFFPKCYQVGYIYQDGEYTTTRFNKNIRLGFKLNNVIKSSEDLRLALILSAYNGGITRLRKNNYDINKMPRETREYVKKIMKLYKEGL